MARKTKPELLALSTGLILSVYGAGYMLTTPAPSLSRASAAPVAHHAGAHRYRDGRYSATGVSDLGTVSVALTIKGGRISDVQITDFTMHYPQSDIDGLPAEVLAAQSATIDWVSGASYSSYSFDSAVAQALAQATAPTTRPATSTPTSVPSTGGA